MVLEALIFGVADAPVLPEGAIGAYALVLGECSTAEGARAAVTGGAATAVVMVRVVEMALGRPEADGQIRNVVGSTALSSDGEAQREGSV